ncbi:hypothetical protein EYF80_038052 [Liparis tanakae]|uniref:Uncharacterized protein n=1 Tax=Liparis tanakae TaxID=230148 RepID=A0A4Z2GEW2_9TELE|nr:hypothetical protein EYF80_038052 [Liparis tanakae]
MAPAPVKRAGSLVSHGTRLPARFTPSPGPHTELTAASWTAQAVRSPRAFGEEKLASASIPALTGQVHGLDTIDIGAVASPYCACAEHAACSAFKEPGQFCPVQRAGEDTGESVSRSKHGSPLGNTLQRRLGIGWNSATHRQYVQTTCEKKERDVHSSPRWRSVSRGSTHRVLAFGLHKPRPPNKHGGRRGGARGSAVRFGNLGLLKPGQTCVYTILTNDFLT